jgi:protein phosphatase
MTLAVEVAGQTDVGCVRANNEDNFGYDARYGIFVVCDGMGGQAAGEVASKMAVDEMLAYFRQSAQNSTASPNGNSLPVKRQDSSTLAEAIHRANHAIYEAAQHGNGRSGMGTTIVAALIQGNTLAIGHVGDSRIYLIRHGEIQQLTQDHSLVMEQVRLGFITAEQAETSELQNVILRALGSEEQVQPDVEDMPALNDDILLMTSDGLTRHLREQEILQIVSESPGLKQSCAALIDTAKNRGGSDNVTCLLLRVVNQPWYKKIFNKLFSGAPQWQNSI